MFPSRVSGRGYKIGPVCLCVCLCVRLLVSALTAKPFDLRSQNFTDELIISTLSVIISCCNASNVCVRRSMGQEY